MITRCVTAGQNLQAPDRHGFPTYYGMTYVWACRVVVEFCKEFVEVENATNNKAVNETTDLLKIGIAGQF